MGFESEYGIKVPPKAGVSTLREKIPEMVSNLALYTPVSLVVRTRGIPFGSGSQSPQKGDDPPVAAGEPPVP